jgi:hypothetical protein
MLNMLLGPGFVPTFLSGLEGKRFPENLPQGETFDLILFTGCNTLPNILPKDADRKQIIRTLASFLTKGGKVIVVEAKGFVEKVGGNYGRHKLTIPIEGLYNHPHVAWDGFKEEYKPTVDYWNTVFERTEQPGGYIAYTAARKSPNKEGMSAEDDCKTLLEAVLAYTDTNKKASYTSIIDHITSTQQGILSKHSIRVVKRVKTAKKSSPQRPVPQGLQGCKELIELLQDSGLTADNKMKRLKELLGRAGGRGATAKRASTNSDSAHTPEAKEEGLPPGWRMVQSKTRGRPYYYHSETKARVWERPTAQPAALGVLDAFRAEDKENRKLATLNQMFKTAFLAPDATYSKEAVEDEKVLKEGADPSIFSIEHARVDKRKTLEQQVHQRMKGKAKEEIDAAIAAAAAAEEVQSVKEFRDLHPEFAGGCDEVKTELECMHADGSNYDCFFHSFLAATCEFYRMAKVQKKPYREFVTAFRKKVVPKIIEFVLEQEDAPRVDLSAEELIEELGASGQFLPDSLYTIIAYYYNCCILLMRPKEADGIRIASLIGNTPEQTYGISNRNRDHFEPLRIVGGKGYKLTGAQGSCMAQAYSQLAGSNSKVDDARFKEMGYLVKLNKPGAEGKIVYDEAAMLAHLEPEDNRPGDVAKAYAGVPGEGYSKTKTAHVRQLEELIQQINAHHRAKSLYLHPAKAKKSQDLKEAVMLLQQEIVDGTKGESDIAAVAKTVQKAAPVARRGGQRTRRKARFA